LKNKILLIQKQLQEQHLDGWLLYDFARNNPLACKVLELPEKTFTTRRFFVWIPARGTPVKIVHQVEPHILDYIDGEKLIYMKWDKLEQYLQKLLAPVKKVAMEYSPRNAIPYISKVDAGTLEVVKSCGVEVLTSANLLQSHTAVLNEEQIASHFKTALFLEKTIDKIWGRISETLENGQHTNEWEVQQWILGEFSDNNYVTSASPMCMVNEHSADPHYFPKKGSCKSIKKGDWVLIDLWCKEHTNNGVYADITIVAIADTKPSEKQKNIFDIVREAQESAIHLIKTRYRKGEPILGWEVDARCRQIISGAGYGEYFTHRTGHSIDTHDHGNGAHIDNFETQDHRELIKGTCFSIEPGIYLPHEFGVRLECNICIDLNGNIHITGGIQESTKLLITP